MKKKKVITEGKVDAIQEATVRAIFPEKEWKPKPVKDWSDMGELKPLEAPTKAQIHAICILSPYFRELKYNQWQIAGHISNALAESLKLNGPDFFSELMPIVHRALASQYWGEANPFSIWRNVYKKASRLAEQKIKLQPKEFHKVVEDLLSVSTTEALT